MWLEIEVFSSRIEADLAKSMIESEGIPVMVQADDQGGMKPHLAFPQGVRILVPEERAEEARELLKGE